MRALTWLVAIVAVLYGGYWFAGARAAKFGVERAVAEAAARGVLISHQDVRVAGFPNRFDVTLDAPQVEFPSIPVKWSGEFVQVFSMSYAPWKLIAAFPQESRIETRQNQMVLSTTRMQSSLFLTPGTSLALNDFKAVAEGVNLRSDRGWALGFKTLKLSLVAGEGSGATAAFLLEDLLPPQQLMEAFTNAGLPEVISRADAVADLTLSAPVQLRGGPPQIEAVNLREATLTWGTLKVSATGTLLADRLGHAEGVINLRVEGWEQGITALDAAGLVPANYRTALRSVVGALAAQSTDSAVLELPVVMANGRMSVGPVPVGAAPLLR